VRTRLRAVAFAILARVLTQARSAQVAMDYVDGLLGDVAANCWQLAEAAGHGSPRRMQDLLGCYAWTGRTCGPSLQASQPRICRAPRQDVAGPGLAIDETRT
jgi:hypothetical protein